MLASAPGGDLMSHHLTDLMIHCSSFKACGVKTTMSIRSVWLLPCPQLYSCAVYFRTANMPLEARS